MGRKSHPLYFVNQPGWKDHCSARKLVMKKSTGKKTGFASWMFPLNHHESKKSWLSVSLFLSLITTYYHYSHFKLMFQTTENMTRSRVPCFQGQTIFFKITNLDFSLQRILSYPLFVWFQRGGKCSHILGCPRRLAKGLQVGYNNPNIHQYTLFYQ